MLLFFCSFFRNRLQILRFYFHNYRLKSTQVALILTNDLTFVAQEFIILLLLFRLNYWDDFLRL